MDADEEESRFAAEPIGRPAVEQRAQHRAVERGAHGEAVHTGTQAPQRLDLLLGTGDDDRVEAEGKPRKRGDD